MKYVGLLATIGVVTLVTRMARRALREAEQSQEGSAVAGKPRFDPNYRPAALDEMTIAGDRYDQQLIDNCHPPGWVNPTPARKYNLVVIGAGTAGLVSAAGAAKLGAKVALIERNLMGGDCLNVGCVPSKAIIRAARAVVDSRNGAEFGLHSNSQPEINFRSCDGEDAAAAGRNQRARFRRPFPQTGCGRLHRQRAVYRTIDN